MSLSDSDESNDDVVPRNSSNSSIDDFDDDEEEDECRVCRGPAEEGRSLFKPCKCSGSIGLTHQDCLTSWLDVTRGDGRCELCSTRFRFAPRYAEGAPDRLPTREVCFRIFRRAGAKWLPFGIRALFAASLWLIVLPLSTSYIYHGWMHRPSAISKRWNWDLAKRDTVGGAVIAIIVVVSFLSLMSFAEFLRFQWNNGNGQQRGGGAAAAAAVGERQGNNNGRQRNGNGGIREGAGRAHAPNPSDDEIDDILDRDCYEEYEIESDGDESEMSSSSPNPNNGPLERNAVGGMDPNGVLEIQEFLRSLGGKVGINERNNVDDSTNEDGQSDDRNNTDRADSSLHDDDHAQMNLSEVNPQLNYNNEAREERQGNDAIDNEDGQSDDDILFEHDDEDELEALVRAQEEQEIAQNQQIENDILEQEPLVPPQQEIRQNHRPRDDARFEPQFEPLQPAFAFEQDDQDDGVDMEINVALDELLGFRGPLFALIRNLLWLLVFNTAYLCVFAFMPSTFGKSVHSLASKLISLPSFNNTNHTNTGTEQIGSRLISSIYELEEKSRESNSIFQPNEIAKIGLGYLAFSCSIFFLTAVVTFVTRMRQSATSRRARGNEGRQGRVNIVNNIPMEQDHIFRRHLVDGGEGIRDEAGHGGDEHIDVAETAGKKLLGILECASAIAKVVLLLFIKMLLLPLLLGVWLDIATLSLFEKTTHDRITYAGGDLFGSIFLHWVAGITFMLLVTVSVLQLREVAHPDILACVIRPQEPQPDLLGNLLQESGITHAKRILLSLGIYAALLTIHVWIPSKFLTSFNIGRYLPFFQPKFRHFVMPQIQVPAELFIFHLCMLGFLEKYKNNIGEMQHHWLVLMGNLLGLADRILPREVEKFVLVGTLPVYDDDEKPDKLEQNPLDMDDEEEKRLIDSRVFSPILNPFWDELLSATDSAKREEIIRLNIKRLEKPATPCHLPGMTRKDGKKVLALHTFIRFRHASSNTKDVSKSSANASSNLLSTCAGAYRLKQGVAKRVALARSVMGSKQISTIARVPVIEIWQEVAGKPIPRPPEGWDDLGIGGAESQGRWAWGDEHLSEIEASVAVRTPFIDKSATKAWSKAHIVLQLTAKMVILLSISWLAITVALCAAMNAPLYIGHIAVNLLRVPDSYVHDPLAFAIGGGLLIPIVGVTAKVFSLSKNGPRGVIYLIRDWLKLLKPHHSREKLQVLVSFVVLWTCICPLLLGYLYGTFFVGKITHWHSLGWSHDMHNLTLQWGTGTLLLNSWAVMCYFRVFTKEFWAGIALGEGQGNANENQDNPFGDVIRRRAEPNNPQEIAAGRGGNVPDNGANNPKKFVWQGEDGIIASSFKCICDFAKSWEWDKLDKQALLHDCILPIFRHIAFACLVPSFATSFISFLYLMFAATKNALEAQSPLRELRSTAIFRTFVITSISIQLLNSKKHGLGRWFEAAHKIARDDRYLIGEILLNYSPPQRPHITSSSS